MVSRNWVASHNNLIVYASSTYYRIGWSNFSPSVGNSPAPKLRSLDLRQKRSILYYSIAQDLRIWYHYNQINPPAWAWQDPLRSHMVKNLLETNGERQHQLLARNGWSFHKQFSIILPRIWLSNYGKPFCVIACITHFSYFLRGFFWISFICSYLCCSNNLSIC